MLVGHKKDGTQRRVQLERNAFLVWVCVWATGPTQMAQSIVSVERSTSATSRDLSVLLPEKTFALIPGPLLFVWPAQEE